MKIIDLLNKIANGEKVPNRIKIYDGEEEFSFEYNPFDTKYETEAGYDMFEIMANWKPVFNYTVEIIEEDKKINYIETNYDFVFDEQVQQDSLRMITSKINELIDEVNKLKDDNK